MGRETSDKRSRRPERIQSSSEEEDRTHRNNKATRINWNGEIGEVVIGLYVDEYHRYKANKAQTAHAWVEKLKRNPRFHKVKLTDLKIKNWITQQEIAFNRAVEKKNGTGFGNLIAKGKEETAVAQLVAICKYW